MKDLIITIFVMSRQIRLVPIVVVHNKIAMSRQIRLVPIVVVHNNIAVVHNNIHRKDLAH
jgi:hypothetical protein